MKKNSEYLSAIREAVCSICVDSDEHGECTLTKNELCAVEYFLPRILEAVHSVENHDMDEYIEALREKVCKYCKTAESEESCHLREDVNCSLDRYFPLIVETILKVDSDH